MVSIGICYPLVHSPLICCYARLEPCCPKRGNVSSEDPRIRAAFAEPKLLVPRRARGTRIMVVIRWSLCLPASRPYSGIVQTASLRWAHAQGAEIEESKRPAVVREGLGVERRCGRMSRALWIAGRLSTRWRISAVFSLPRTDEIGLSPAKHSQLRTGKKSSSSRIAILSLPRRLPQLYAH